jgi:hypothetical protein
MPGRLDHVTIGLKSGTVTLPWASRDALLAHVNVITDGADIKRAFEAVGASRPVSLELADKAILLGVIRLWAADAPGGFGGLPPGIHELRAGLRADVQREMDASGSGHVRIA